MITSLRHDSRKASSTSIETYSTRDVEKSHRFEHWMEFLGSTYVPLQSTEGDRENFYGSIRKTSIGHVDLSIVQSTSPCVRRTTELINRQDGEYLLVHCAHAGPAMIRQSKRSVILKPGDIAVYQSAEPYELNFNGWFDTRVIKIPMTAIKPYIRNIGDLTAKKIDKSSLECVMLRGMIASVWGERLVNFRGINPIIMDAFIQVVCAALQKMDAAIENDLSNLEIFYVAKAKSYIRKNLQRNTLNISEIAASIGISPRHLARLFENEPMSVTRLIWHERLEGCRRDLSRSCSDKRSISEIAYSWGFSNASHFSKAFDLKYGVSPKDWIATQI